MDVDGHVKTRDRTLKVNIPKGIKDKQQIRLSGQGSAGIGGADAGDLYLEVSFKPHALYRVEVKDLYFDLPLAPWEAALGAKVKVPTPSGTIEVKIPKGSISGNKLRLKGKGIPGSLAGDLYAVLRITLPPADSEKAEAIYRKMESELSFNPRAGLGI